jgi:hypothetical protein
MDGGVLSVPFDTLDEFHERYIEAILAREKVYIVEQKTETYNFFVDLDYKDRTPLGLEAIQRICKNICETVGRFGDQPCLISAAKPKPCGVDDLIKSGIHMNWNGLVVDCVSGNALRDHILIGLTRFDGTMDWNEIIDASVYGNISRKSKGSGFRMPWSHKRAKHEPCGGQGCADCENGKIDQVAYLPLYIYTKGPLRLMVRADPKPSLETLKMAVVRTNTKTTVPIEPPSISLIKNEGSFTTEETRDEIHDDQVQRQIESFIVKNMVGQSESSVLKVFRYKDTYIVSSTSHYCENLRREHASNHVWFMIIGRTIVQKCFCRCETIRGRRDGFCKDFSGQRHTLPDTIVDVLYPDPSKRPTTQPSKSKIPTIYPPVPDLAHFINTYMRIPGQEPVSVVNRTRDPKRKRDIILTTSTFCESIRKPHNDSTYMSYMVNVSNHEIKQFCPICKGKNVRLHRLKKEFRS